MWLSPQKGKIKPPGTWRLTRVFSKNTGNRTLGMQGSLACGEPGTGRAVGCACHVSAAPFPGAGLDRGPSSLEGEEMRVSLRSSMQGLGLCILMPVGYSRRPLWPCWLRVFTRPHVRGVRTAQQRHSEWRLLQVILLWIHRKKNLQTRSSVLRLF